jgi:arylsulfatase A-like enzyme
MVCTVVVKLREAARWLLRSLVAAAIGALSAGVVEALHADGLVTALASAGFVVVLMFPLLFATDVTIRGLWRAWDVDTLSLVESDGSAPRLAAWTLVIGLGAAVLGAIVFAATRQLGESTSFAPVVVSYVDPLVAVIAVLLMLAVCRPVARVLTHVLGSQKWLTARRIAVIVGSTIIIAGAALWIFVVGPALGPLDLSVLAAPLVAIAATALVHVCWRFVPRTSLLAVPPVLALAAAVAALVLRFANPPVVLYVWGEMPVGGFAVQTVFDLESIRADIPLSEFQPRSVPGARHRDIIVVTIDTVRADHTPPYGGHAEMPMLMALAARGAVFDWAFAPSNVTRRSIPSMMIGLQPNRVHGRVVGWALRVDPRHVMLAERMRAGGYDTAGFMCCEGFWGKQFHTGLEHGLEHLTIDHNGLALARKAHDWLATREQSHPTRPLFVWMHILEPHNWPGFGPEARTDAERSAVYDRALTASDAMIKQLLTPFEHRAADDMPIVIVTADHGEGLGEHGHPFHSTDLYNSQIHVPLVISGPSIVHAHLAESVSLTDLAPTVLELAGFAPTHTMFDGDSFGALATGSRAADPQRGEAFAAMVKDRSNPGGMVAMVSGPWKLIDDHGKLHLFDVHADPNEHADLATAHPDVLARLRALLDAHVRAGRHSPFP